MLLSALNTGSHDEDVWTATTEVQSSPEEVLCALTDPGSIAQWAPVSFEVDGLACGRLRAGSRERVSGSIAGITATFDVEVSRADRRGLELVANGPVSLDVAYSILEQRQGVTVDASVSIRRQRGLTAQLLRAAVGALLNAGALGGALRRLEGALSCPADPELLAA
jgi:hypothetical protein